MIRDPGFPSRAERVSLITKSFTSLLAAAASLCRLVLQIELTAPSRPSLLAAACCPTFRLHLRGLAFQWTNDALHQRLTGIPVPRSPHLRHPHFFLLMHPALQAVGKRLTIAFRRIKLYDRENSLKDAACAPRLVMTVRLWTGKQETRHSLIHSL